MFKDLLVKWVTELSNKFSSVGTSGFLSIGIESFNSTLYGYVKGIMANVILPVAYVILALFFVLELYKASTRVDGVGGGSSFGAEIIFKVMFRMVLCKVAVDSSLLFMEAIYSVGQNLINGISAVISSNLAVYNLNLNELIVEINNMNLGEQIGMLLELFIIKIAVTVIVGLIEVFCVGRFIQIYIYTAISPIPIATFPSNELSQIGKGFLKSFASICLQGVIIYLSLSFFPVLVNSNILGEIGLLGLLLYSLVLATSIFTSNKLAKSILNAM